MTHTMVFDKPTAIAKVPILVHTVEGAIGVSIRVWKVFMVESTGFGISLVL